MWDFVRSRLACRAHGHGHALRMLPAAIHKGHPRFAAAVRRAVDQTNAELGNAGCAWRLEHAESEPGSSAVVVATRQVECSIGIDPPYVTYDEVPEEIARSLGTKINSFFQDDRAESKRRA